MLVMIGLIAAGIVAGFVTFMFIKKLTVKDIIGVVHKFLAKGAAKVMVADINAMVAQCPNRKSLKELEKLQDQGVAHVAAGVDEYNEIVGNVQMIQDEEAAYEVVDLLGDEDMLVIEG